MPADFLTDYPRYLSLFLIAFCRIGGIVMLLPFFSDEAAPVRIRLFIALGITLGLIGLVLPAIEPLMTSPRSLPMLVMAELIVGISLGVIMRMMFQSIAAAGSIISFQIGLSSAMISDPAMGGQSTVVSRFLLLAATLVCLSLNLHHLWIAAVLKSYDHFPVGQLPPARDMADLAVQTLTHSLVLALSLSAPLIAFGVVFNFALALVTRMAPSLQLFMMLAPLNLLLGVALLAATAGAILSAFAAIYGDWLNTGWTVSRG